MFKGKSSISVRNVIIAVAAVIFGLFFIIGFNRPYIENANFNDPLFTWPLLAFVALLLLAAIGIVVWSVVLSVKRGDFASSHDNLVPVRKISLTVAGGTFLLLLITFVVGSSHELVINGDTFTNVFWLKAANMFTVSSVVLVVIASLILIYSSIKRHV